MIDWNQVLMALGFGAGGAVLGMAVAWFTARGDRHRAMALYAFAGLALAVGIGQMLFPPPTRQEQIGRDMDQNALFRIAFAEEPGLRDKVVTRLDHAQASGGTDAYLRESEKIGRELGQRYMPLLAARASAGALDVFLDFTIAMLEERHDHAPAACYSQMVGGDAAELGALPVRLQQQADTALHGLVDSAEGVTAAVMTGADRQVTQAQVEEIARAIAQGPEGTSMYVTDYGRYPATTPEQRKGACLFALRLHQAIRAAPQPGRANLVRVMMGAAP